MILISNKGILLALTFLASLTTGCLEGSDNEILSDELHSPGPFVVHENTLYFGASSERLGHALYSMAAKDSEPQFIADFYPGPDGAYLELYSSPLGLLIIPDHPDYGREPWILESNLTEPRLVADICEGTCDSNPYSFTWSESALFFVAYSEGDGFELYRSEGEESTTTLVFESEPGPDYNTIRNLAFRGGDVLFLGGKGNDELHIFKLNSSSLQATNVSHGLIEGAGRISHLWVGDNSLITMGNPVHFGRTEGTQVNNWYAGEFHTVYTPSDETRGAMFRPTLQAGDDLIFFELDSSEGVVRLMSTSVHNNSSHYIESPASCPEVQSLLEANESRLIFACSSPQATAVVLHDRTTGNQTVLQPSSDLLRDQVVAWHATEGGWFIISMDNELSFGVDVHFLSDDGEFSRLSTFSSLTGVMQAYSIVYDGALFFSALDEYGEIRGFRISSQGESTQFV